METNNSDKSYDTGSTKPFPLRIYVSQVVDFSQFDMNLVLRQISLRGRKKTTRISNPVVRNLSLTAEFLLWHVLTCSTGVFADGSMMTGLLTSRDPHIKRSDMTEDNSPHFKNIWGLSDIPDIEETEDGKPYLKKYPDICFSLSHSGAYVLCAAGSENVGADIQQKEKLHSDIAGRFFTDAERRYIDHSDDPISAFYHIWVLKESYVKYTGRGLAEGIDSFNVISAPTHSVYSDNKPDQRDANDQHVIDSSQAVSDEIIPDNSSELNLKKRVEIKRCVKDTFGLDIEHRQGEKLHLAVYDMNAYDLDNNPANGCCNDQKYLDRYAIGVCYTGKIDLKPQIIDIQHIAEEAQLQGGSL